MIRAAFIFMLLTTACTTPGKVETLDDDGFEKKGKTAEGVVGVNDSGQAVIKTERQADVELQSQQMANYSMRERLGWEMADLKRCHEDAATLSDGDAVKSAPTIDIPDDVAADEKVGLSKEGELKVVGEELYTEKLKEERSRGTKLYELLKKAKRLNEECQSDLRIARGKKAKNTP